MSSKKSKRNVVKTISSILAQVVSIDMESIEKISQHIEMLRINDPKQDTKGIQAFLEFRKTLNKLYEEGKDERR